MKKKPLPKRQQHEERLTREEIEVREKHGFDESKINENFVRMKRVSLPSGKTTLIPM
jgi:hypothetical protein